MPHAYAQIAFTPAVRRLQQELGSREQYVFLDALEDANSSFTEREAAFIESRDTLYQATVSETGWPYVQHRGGPPGFIKVLDKHTIAFPDFRGNVQYLSVANLKRDDRISIILLDPAKQRRLKLLGHVTLVEAGSHPELFDRLRLDGHGAQVERAFVIKVAAFDWNCPQHITPRFTEEEIARMTAPLRTRLQHAEAKLAELARRAPVGGGRGMPMGEGAIALVVAATRQLTPAVRAYELRHPDGLDLPMFTPGAHLEVPVQLPDGKPATRHYSISSAASDRTRYEIAVLRETDGAGGSAHVHDSWGLGTRLQVDVPKNYFPLAGEAVHSVLIAGGIGITPLKSMAAALAQAGRSFELHHTGRSRAASPFSEQLAAEFGERYTHHPGGAETRAHFEQLLLKAVAADVHLYVCGPASMMASLRERARSLGVPDRQFHSERFGAAPPDAGAAPIEVHLRKSGRVIPVAAQETILEALEREGVPAPSSCRVGICSTCAVRVLDGVPEHRDEVLSPAQRSSGQVMCICVSRAKTPSITLDL